MGTNGVKELPQIAVEYVDDVIRKMRWRRRVREDVRQELMDHFADALNHMSGEAEREKEAQKLISEFGDAAMLGKLMRRAKKRCRPWWVKFMIRSCQVVGSFLLLIVLYSAWFLSGKPVISTDYVSKYNQYSRPEINIDESQNGLELYTKATDSYVDLSEIVDGKKFNTRKMQDYSAISQEDEIVIREWIEANQKSIDYFEAGSLKPYFYREYTSETGEVVTMLVPHLSEWRSLTRVILWRAYFAASDGDFKSAFDDLLVSYRASKHRYSRKTLIEQLVGLACLKYSNMTLLNIVNDFDVPQDDLVYIKDELSKIKERFDFMLDFEGEKYLALDEVQRSIVETPIGGHFYLKRARFSAYKAMYGELNSVSDNLKVLFAFPDKEKQFEVIDSFYDKMKNYSKTPPYMIDDLESILRESSSQYFLLGNLSEPFARCILTNYRTQADFDAANLILALHVYKADKGVYPDSLTPLLCDGYIQEIPVNPFSGERLVYSREGDSFVLYSFGVDETDDGGKRLSLKDKSDCGSIWDDKGYDNVFWPLEEI
ncbi:MAG: hypothetical protein ACIAQZ_03985 [Sedimentisphaeraceae bacterium JB056]